MGKLAKQRKKLNNNCRFYFLSEDSIFNEHEIKLNYIPYSYFFDNVNIKDGYYLVVDSSKFPKNNFKSNKRYDYKSFYRKINNNYYKIDDFFDSRFTLKKPYLKGSLSKTEYDNLIKIKTKYLSHKAIQLLYNYELELSLIQSKIEIRKSLSHIKKIS